MKRWVTVLAAALGALLLLVCAGAATAAVAVKRVPLAWQDIAHNDGGLMYDRLCASCHGAGGKGDGPAAYQLDNGAPDLTVLTVHHGGVYPEDYVTHAIVGDSRSRAHHGLDMPAWEEQFSYAGPGWHSFPRRKLAKDRIQALTLHVESLQVE